MKLIRALIQKDLSRTNPYELLAYLTAFLIVIAAISFAASLPK